MKPNLSYKELLSELEETRIKLEEANDTIDAIKSGNIDALVFKNDTGHQVFTLKGTDQAYRIFIEQMTEGAVTLNEIGNILYSNSQFSSLVGLPLEKVIGQPLVSFIHYDKVKCEDAIKRARESEYKGEFLLEHRSGKSLPVLLSLKTLDLDETSAMSVIVTDLSNQKETQSLLQKKNDELEEAQKRATYLNENLERTVAERTSALEQNIFEKTEIEKELRSHREQLTRILETMAEGVIIVDINGSITYANPLGQKILKLSLDPAEHVFHYNPGYQFLHLDGSPLEEHELPMTVTMKSGQPIYDFEIAVQPRDKNIFYISVNTAAIRNDYNMIIGVVSTFMDVTNRRKALQNKDEFISVASHELRTPVTTLKASLQLLNRTKNDTSSAMSVKLIEQANRSLTKVSVLIEDLLDATRMTDGQLHLRKQTFKVASIIEDQLQNEIVRRQNIIVEGNLDLVIYGDANKISQVLDNFLNNASKYAGCSKHVRITVEDLDSVVKFSVTDEGPGILPEKIPYLFERFYRADDEGVQYSGLGLGLYICSQIIKKHNGKIGAESEVGKGSTFWFTLPLERK